MYINSAKLACIEENRCSGTTRIIIWMLSLLATVLLQLLLLLSFLVLSKLNYCSLLSFLLLCLLLIPFIVSCFHFMPLLLLPLLLLTTSSIWWENVCSIQTCAICCDLQICTYLCINNILLNFIAFHLGFQSEWNWYNFHNNAYVICT